MRTPKQRAATNRNFSLSAVRAAMAHMKRIERVAKQAGIKSRARNVRAELSSLEGWIAQSPTWGWR